MTLMLVIFYGCGDSGTDISDTATEEADGDVDDEATEVESDGEQEGSDSDDGSELSTGDEYNYLIQTKMHTDESDDGQYMTLYNGSYDTIYMTDAGKNKYPELWKTLETYNENTESGFLSTYEQYLDEAKDWYAEVGPDGFMGGYGDENHIFISRSDDSFLSFVTDLYSYAGGAHGSYTKVGYNYDVHTGQQLALKDVITDIPHLQEVVIAKLKNDYPGVELVSTFEEAVPEYLTGEEDQECAWYMTPQGIDIYFGVYLIGSYADGAQVAHILYNDNPELFYEGFHVQQGDYVENIDTYGNYYTDINGDGKTDILSLEFEYDENYSIEKMGISINGNKTNVDTYGYEVSPTLIHKGSDTYMYAEFSQDNDYYVTYAYKIAENGAQQIAQYSGRITGMTPAEDYESEWFTTWDEMFAVSEGMYLMDRMQLLSTYTGLAKLTIGDDGKLLFQEGFYYAQLYGDSGRLTALKDVKAAAVDPDTRQVISENEMIPKGKQVVIYGTDNSSYVDVKDDEGNMFRLTIDSTEWPQTIGGENIEDLFDGLIFAG